MPMTWDIQHTQSTPADEREAIHQLAFERGGTEGGEYLLGADDLDAVIDYTFQVGAAYQHQQALEVVMPERKKRPYGFTHMPSHYEGWNACLDEIARLNKGVDSHE